MKRAQYAIFDAAGHAGKRRKEGRTVEGTITLHAISFSGKGVFTENAAAPTMDDIEDKTSGSKSRILRVARLLDSAIRSGRGGDPQFFKQKISSDLFFY